MVNRVSVGCFCSRIIEIAIPDSVFCKNISEIDSKVIKLLESVL